MVSDGKIREWWNKNFENYIQNYAKRNKLTLAKYREKIFTEAHEKFIEAIPYELNKLINQIN